MAFVPITDLAQRDDQVLRIISAIRLLSDEEVTTENIFSILRDAPKDGKGAYSKSELVAAYKRLCGENVLTFERETLRRLQMKPTRTISGVAPVTVLTKPYPCPGKCIFCPTDARMPKSYLHDEPGAMRAEMHAFDPYNQTFARIKAFEDLGHSAKKVELLILGGTWSSYKRDYQEWFIQRCMDAMNGRDSSSLEEAQIWNETSKHRNVGLVIETRPDHINPDEIRWLRRLGVTKVQMGAQSLDDHVLDLNKRGHTVEQTRQAVTMLKAAGFKIVLHWMPNLLGATPESDRADYLKLWSDVALRPDELKIYPCSLLANAELYEYWQRGEYHPYSDEELIDLIADSMARTPRYCRINRVIRDIPAPNIVAGSKRSNMRQDADREMHKRGLRCECLRCREVRGSSVNANELRLDVMKYETRFGMENFISFVTRDDKVAGFLRLSLPDLTPNPSPNDKEHERNLVRGARLGLPEIENAAMIREVHVYGPSLGLGDESEGEAQHVGVGLNLINAAQELAASAGFKKLAVISAIGTRPYYRKRGFEIDGLYMTRNLPEGSEPSGS